VTGEIGHKRLFVGARVSVATASLLAGVAETLARRARDAGVDVRWIAPTNYHITLAFLGNTRIDAIAAVHDALCAAVQATSHIKLRTARLGAFPSLEKARVVWAGVEDLDHTKPFAALVKRIGEGLGRLGFADPGKPFHAHVTLGRARETRPLKEVVLPVAEQMFGDTRLDAISLYESETKSSGSVYREVYKIGFQAAETGPESAAERQTRALDVVGREEAMTVETDDGWPRGHRTD
jgi:RNA 2',3'-cyclic 3'-phosphodiesterase